MTQAQKNKKIGLSMADGKVTYCYSYDNGDFELRTDKQGMVYIREGKIIN